MAIKTETRSIGGREIRIRQLPYRDARRVFLTLAKLLGPGLIDTISGAASVADLRAGKVDPVALVKGFRDLLHRLEDDQIEALAETFGMACEASMGGDRWATMRAGIRDEIFTGSLTDSFRWLAACVEVNYSDFFSALRDLPANVQGGGETPRG